MFNLLPILAAGKSDRSAETKEDRSNETVDKENVTTKRNRRNKTNSRQSNKSEQQSTDGSKESNKILSRDSRNRTTSKSYCSVMDLSFRYQKSKMWKRQSLSFLAVMHVLLIVHHQGKPSH